MKDDTEAIEVLRRFNRSYTQRIGVLESSFLGLGRPVGPSRLLFEIGVDGSTVRGLRDRLGLDAGYVSRMLRDLEAEGLVTVAPDPSDRRRRVARTTAKGERVWHTLDQRSDRLAGALIAPLSERQRSELCDAITSADRLLRAATIVFEVVDPASTQARDAVVAYFSELDRRFPGGFDPGGHGFDDASAAEASSFRSPLGRFLVARSDEDVVGCGALQHFDDTTGEIKRMWISPSVRGLGVGRRLLAELERHAAEIGWTRVVLDTNTVLTEAISMYETSGYVRRSRYNDNPYAGAWFEKRLVVA